MKYDSTLFDPPAPVARVTIANPITGRTLADVPMLLDTGADVSLIPQWCIEQLGIPSQVDQDYVLAGYDGTRKMAPAVIAHLSFLSRLFKGKFLVREDPVGVIGRNVLNHLSLRLDGKTLTWQLET